MIDVLIQGASKVHVLGLVYLAFVREHRRAIIVTPGGDPDGPYRMVETPHVHRLVATDAGLKSGRGPRHQYAGPK